MDSRGSKPINILLPPTSVLGHQLPSQGPWEVEEPGPLPHCTESNAEGQRGEGLAQSHTKTKTQYLQTPARDVPEGGPESLAAPPSGSLACLPALAEAPARARLPQTGITLSVLSMC